VDALTGRDEATAALRRRVDDARRGEGRLVVVLDDLQSAGAGCVRVLDLIARQSRRSWVLRRIVTPTAPFNILLEGRR
jgi:hypothetical protein